MYKHIADQHRSLLSFLSGKFNSTQLVWSILEKRAFSVMATLDRIHWPVSDPDRFDLFTNHNNLISIFDHLAVFLDITQTTVRNLLRWAVRLILYTFTFIHIKVNDNVWAVLLSRWPALLSVRRLVEFSPLPSSSSEEFLWPKMSSVLGDQKNVLSFRLPNTQFN